MAVDRFQIKVEQTGEMEPPILTDAQLMAIGKVMVTAQKDRWQKSIDSTGARAKPLAPKTAKMKAAYRHIANPQRDMVMTGLTAASFDVQVATAGVIVAAPGSLEGQRRARKAQAFDEMVGLAPTDQAIVEAEIEQAYADYLMTAWRPRKP